MPDKDYGEIISAIVVPHEAQAAAAAAKWEPVLTLEALRDWARPLLAPYKVNCSLTSMSKFLHIELLLALI